MSTSSGSPAVSRDTTPTQSPNQINNGAASSTMTIQTVPEDSLPEILKISKSKGADVLGTYYQENPEGMYFSDLGEALAAISHEQWQPPANDATIPRDNEQDRAIVRRLVAAFLDLDSAMDTEGNAYRKRFTPGTTVFYNPWTIERCAWEILYMVKSMHLEGFTAPIFDADILKCIGQTEQWTFEERISMICRVVKISKSVAVSLMKHEKVWTTIGAPHKLYNSTLVNTQSNAYRNKWVKAGREAEKANGERSTIKRKRSSVSNTSRKSSASIAPSPLVNTFPSQSSPPTSSAHPSHNGSNRDAHPSPIPTSAPPATTSDTRPYRPRATPGRPSNNVGNGYRRPSFTPAPIATQMSLPYTAPWSAVDALRSSMRTPMATTSTSHSSSPYAVPAPLGRKIANVKLRASSAPTFPPRPAPAPAPAALTIPVLVPDAARGPAPTSASVDNDVDNDVDMTDATSIVPLEANNEDAKHDAASIPTKLATHVEIPSVSRSSTVEAKSAQAQASGPEVADPVTTQSLTTAPDSSARSAAEFDAAEMLLGLRKIDG